MWPSPYDRAYSWQDAENDATEALKLSINDAALEQKALFRRSRARRAQGDEMGARTGKNFLFMIAQPYHSLVQT
jgi:hypothetical protein